MIILSSFLLFLNLSIYSQNTDNSFQEQDILDSLKTKNSLDFGINKLQNIYNYYLGLNYLNNFDFLEFELNQYYLGNTLISTPKISKDEESLNLRLQTKLTSNLHLVSLSNYQLIDYPGSMELTKIERYNTLLGSKFLSYNTNQEVIFLIGPESNSQVGYTSSGIYSKFNLLLKENNIEDFIINFYANSDVLSLDRGRLNKSISINTDLFKNFEGNENLKLNLNYRLLDRFYLTRRDSNYINTNLLDYHYNIENRLSNNYYSELLASLLFFDVIQSNLRINYGLNNISKNFSEYVVSDTKTGIMQSRDNQKISIEATFDYIGFINQNIGIYYYSESEINKVNNRNSISAQEYLRYNDLAFDLNIEQSILKLFGRTSYLVNPNDSIEFKYSTSITRFDTPSPRNNSDRDELLSKLGLNYNKKISPVLDFRILTEYESSHLVNIKASQSNSNYLMQTLILATQFALKVKNFSMRPTFSILANYVVYDFETPNQQTRSYSLRQLIYNDSLIYNFNRKLNLTTKLDVIYKETGMLYWSSFEELPITANLRFFSNLMINNIEENYSASVGIRYYQLEMNNLINSDLKYINLSYGPEVNLKFRFNSSNILEFSGWYEFQIVNNQLTNQLPNFMLKSIIFL